MKKFLLSLAAVLVCASLSAKTELTEITFSNIEADGTVGSWAWCQSNSLNDAHWDVSEANDSTWVEATYDYADASKYDYIVLTTEETSLAANFFIQHTDWADSNRYPAELGAGQQFVGVPVSELGEGAAAIQTFIIQPKGAGIIKNPKIAYVSTEEYNEMLAAENSREKSAIKLENTEVTKIGSWEQPTWFGEENLDTQFKTIVLELGKVSATTTVVFMEWPGGAQHTYTLAASDAPQTIALSLADCAQPGLGTIAFQNNNYTSFAIDSIYGMPVAVTGPCAVTINKVYYTSKEVASSYTEGKAAGIPMITFDGELADSYACPTLEGFVLNAVNTGEKQAIDDNNAMFGLAAGAVVEDTISGGAFKFTRRLKTGGASGSKNSLSLSIPADGVLTLAVRSASSNAVDRKVTLKQNGEELYSDIVMDAMSVSFENEDGTKAVAYPMIAVPVKAGTVEISYSAAVNFYAFALGSGYYVEQEKEEPVDPTPSEPVIEGDEIVVWEGEVTTSGWSGQNLLTDGCPEFVAQGIKVGDAIRLYFTCTETLNLNVIGGHWEKIEGTEDLIILSHEYSSPNVLDHTDIVVTEDILKMLTSAQGWGTGMMIQADKATTCTKITLIKAAEPSADGTVAFEGSEELGWGGTKIDGAAFQGLTAPVQIAITVQSTTGGWWQFKLVNAGDWGSLNLGGSEFMNANSVEGFPWNSDDFTYTVTLDEAQLAAAQGGMYGQGSGGDDGGKIILKKIVVLSGDSAIETVAAAPANEAIFNLAGQRINSNTGLMIRGGKLILVK